LIPQQLSDMPVEYQRTSIQEQCLWKKSCQPAAVADKMHCRWNADCATELI